MRGPRGSGTKTRSLETGCLRIFRHEAARGGYWIANPSAFPVGAPRRIGGHSSRRHRILCQARRRSGMDEAARLSALIANIYDAALDPSLWPGVLGQARQ